MKTKYLSTYLDKQQVYFFSLSFCAEILRQAVEDELEVLLVTKEQYKTISHFMIHSGAWNWDKKTFMGIKIELSE